MVVSLLSLVQQQPSNARHQLSARKLPPPSTKVRILAWLPRLMHVAPTAATRHNGMARSTGAASLPPRRKHESRLLEYPCCCSRAGKHWLPERRSSGSSRRLQERR